ncbi:MAG: 16S rRNA (cytidine(1402)-2'-O)-methyltransferase [Candidatus Yanofskybacteria bacterium]|nr:16S rRNA (cytidine(1402)-2'-O)-methyltransferase [Candidatus Yanofskybacteria bacterium]
MTTLYVVATPIGNLEDISIRAINVLSNVDFILAEDTRVTRVLLDRYNIKKEVISYHQHSGLQKIDRVIELLSKRHTLALVSDAGTPGINDPGSFLIQKVLEALPETKIVPIPGPNAASTALSASGFPADTFRYLGFVPHKKGRQTFFKNIEHMPETLVFYESKHRIGKTLEALKAVLGERPLLVARELTKQFETLYRGTIEQVASAVMGDKNLGEFVIVIGPYLKKHGE